MMHHLLLIDDDEDELDFFRMAEDKFPGLFKCSYLANAIGAVKAITELKPDLIFLDLNMPAVNGLECLAMIKNTSKGKETPVVLYSTHIDAVTSRKALDLGARDCVKKPIMVSAFFDMLQGFLKKMDVG